jgi:hypothetical protein
MSLSDFLTDCNLAVNHAPGWELHNVKGLSAAEGNATMALQDALGAVLPPQETAELIQQAGTTNLIKNPQYQQFLSSLISEYHSALTACQEMLELLSQTGGTDVLIAINTDMQTITELLTFIHYEAGQQLQQQRQEIQAIRGM